MRSRSLFGRLAGAMQAISTRKLVASLCGLALASFLFVLVVATPPAMISDLAPSLQQSLSKISVPDFLSGSDRAPSAHRPPKPVNSTASDSNWYSSYKWLLHPFSSSISESENRVALPALPKRCPIYAYYDTPPLATDEQKKVDDKILLAWRRAWWAKGFFPVVLGARDAEAAGEWMRVSTLWGVERGSGTSGMWSKIGAAIKPSSGKKGDDKEQVRKDKEADHARASSRIKVGPDMEEDLKRWLAWSSVTKHDPSGILADWRVFPVAAHDAPTLKYLRACEFPQVTRYEQFGSSLLSGSNRAIDQILAYLVENAPTLLVAPETPIKIADEGSKGKENGKPNTVVTNKAPEESNASFQQFAEGKEDKTTQDKKVNGKTQAGSKNQGNAGAPSTSHARKRAESTKEDKGPSKAPLVKSVVDAIASSTRATELFHIEPLPPSLALYSPELVKSLYPSTAYASIPSLINNHLHQAFLAEYPDGIRVLSPRSPRMEKNFFFPFIKTTRSLGDRIGLCPFTESLKPSCPPNQPACTPCSSNENARLPSHLTNNTKSYTLAVIPHPGTYLTLISRKHTWPYSFIRRSTQRDPFLREITASKYYRADPKDLTLEWLDKEGGILRAPPKVALPMADTDPGIGYLAHRMKEILGAPYAAVGRRRKSADQQKEPSVLFRIWEKGWKDVDTEYRLGFTLPPFSKEKQEELDRNQGVYKHTQAQITEGLLNAASSHVYTRVSQYMRVRQAVEAWNLGDWEIWKFVEALGEREVTERERWEEGEKEYGRGMERKSR